MTRLENCRYNLSRVIENEIQNRELAGANIGLIKDEKVLYMENYGYANLESSIPVQNDTIFRLYSLSKPIAAIVSMMYWERGYFDIYEPVSRYLPEFRHIKVFQDHMLTDAKREILIRDLLNMTSGIVYPDTDDAGREAGKLFDEIQADIYRDRGVRTRELVRRMAGCPLAHQPGERWRYGFGCDVMGAILEVISGKKLSEIYQEELFVPLGMKDTGFYVPSEKIKRFSELYIYKQVETGHWLEPEMQRHLCLTKCLKEPAFESAGAGLVSTLDDFLKFASMIANKGVSHGKRYLSEKTIEYLQQNQLEGQQMADKECEHMHGYGYGNFMRVYMDHARSGSLGTIGEIGWDGWTGTYFMANPCENFAIVMMTQRCGYVNPGLMRKIRNIAYVMLEESGC